MRYVECPAIYSGNDLSLFLAGGISGCLDWQKVLIDLLQDTNFTILNPRRQKFDLSKKDIEDEQISWEYSHLNKASAVSFWFPCETLCPITLYELGKQSMSSKPIFVGVHPEYSRKKDLEIQTSLIRPEVKIVYSLEELAKQIMGWSK